MSPSATTHATPPFPILPTPLPPLLPKAGPVQRTSDMRRRRGARATHARYRRPIRVSGVSFFSHPLVCCCRRAGSLPTGLALLDEQTNTIMQHHARRRSLQVCLPVSSRHCHQPALPDGFLLCETRHNMGGDMQPPAALAAARAAVNHTMFPVFALLFSAADDLPSVG